MRILVHDFSGHPFQVELSRSLAAAGHEVVHAWSTEYLSGQGSLERLPDDPDSFSLVPLGVGRPFPKYDIRRRTLYEAAYARSMIRLTRSTQPDVVLACNEPLLARAMFGAWCRRTRQSWVCWLQDLYSVGMRRELESRFAVLGGPLGATFGRLERSLLRSSDGVVAITDAFVDWMRDQDVPTDSTIVVPNWAPLGDLDYHPEARGAFERHGIAAGSRVALYSGTLGRKHDGGHLLAAARSIEPQGGQLVVISEGDSADQLRRHAASGEHPNLHVLPFQPWAEFSALLASADVLLAVLEPEAGAFSVPSKVLTYLAAGRAVVALLPAANQAATVVSEAGAGTVVTSDDPDDFGHAVAAMLADPARSAACGRAARAYAERSFAITPIMRQFEAHLEAAADLRAEVANAHA